MFLWVGEGSQGTGGGEATVFGKKRVPASDGLLARFRPGLTF